MPAHQLVTDYQGRRPIINGELYCSRCQLFKPLAEFSKKLDFYASRCRVCAAEVQALLKYGVTPTQYLKMLEAQGGVCAICKLPEKRYKRLSVDHDRSCCAGGKSCGKCVRGLLCSSCNPMIGYSHDTPKVLRDAALYLEERAI